MVRALTLTNIKNTIEYSMTDIDLEKRKDAENKFYKKKTQFGAL